MTRLRNILLSTTCLVAIAAAGSAQAAGVPQGYGGLPNYANLPAVSGLNGKLSVFGGINGLPEQYVGTRNGSLYGVTGSLSVPLSHAYGLQIDGMVGSGRSSAFYGIGGHLFWRDPAKGLLGFYASYVNWDAVVGGAYGYPGVTGADVGKVGAEGAAYLGRVSLEGLATYQFGKFDGFNGKALLAYYPTDNFRIDGGIRYMEGAGTIGVVDAEWLPHSGSGFSLYAKGSFGANDFKQVLGGVRYYFGDPNKSLIDRQRQDDPSNNLPDDLFTGGCPTGSHYYSSDGVGACVPSTPSPS